MTSFDKDAYGPYESPLKLFKAYRYHADYLTNVQGGYRSLTYSNKIMPDTFLCPFETAGGACNDQTCPYQHFRSMSLTGAWCIQSKEAACFRVLAANQQTLTLDDSLLMDFGMANPGTTLDRRSKWTEGLKRLLRNLRERKIGDAEVVAAEIAAYRRRFLNDPSKVLAL